MKKPGRVSPKLTGPTDGALIVNNFAVGWVHTQDLVLGCGCAAPCLCG